MIVAVIYLIAFLAILADIGWERIQKRRRAEEDDQRHHFYMREVRRHGR